jgi:hypothetical protein
MREIRSSSARLTSESAPRPMSLGLPRIASFRGEKKDDRCMTKLSDQHL